MARFIFGRLFTIWRESRTPLLARLKASRRPLRPAREGCRPGPMLVTLRPARSGPPDWIGVRREHDRRGGRSGPAAAWGGPRRTRPHRPSRRPGGRPASTANRRSGRSCSTPTRPGGRNICQLHEMPGETIPRRAVAIGRYLPVETELSACSGRNNCMENAPRLDRPETRRKSPLEIARKAMAEAGEALPRYSSRFSRHDYTQHQLYALVALRRLLRTDYRGLEATLRNWTRAPQRAGAGPRTRPLDDPAGRTAAGGGRKGQEGRAGFVLASSVASDAAVRPDGAGPGDSRGGRARPGRGPGRRQRGLTGPAGPANATQFNDARGPSPGRGRFHVQRSGFSRGMRLAIAISWAGTLTRETTRGATP